MRKTTLFLLRTYNDIDHIVPVIWKAVSSGWPAYIFFGGQDYSDDYRIKSVLDEGATVVGNESITWYHDSLRHLILPISLRRLCDRIMAYSVGLYLILRYDIEVVVNEWSGPFGREKAEYILRAAKLVQIPIYSLPHGYFVWKNSLYNRELISHYQEYARFPDFKNRDWFSRYVVQSTEHQEANIEFGMNPDKLIVLGSARFCEEWSSINQVLLRDYEQKQLLQDTFTILFFLPHWDYNVHRDQCINLLSSMSDLKGVRLIIKAHTRGSGALSFEEKHSLQSKTSVMFADTTDHSASLVRVADVIINFGSSVAFEALRQGKFVINPIYLHENRTFFDGTGAVYDVTREDQVLDCIKRRQSGQGENIDSSAIDRFLLERVDGGVKGKDVLQDYLDLISGMFEQDRLN
jgi:glycosyltransferase involved in cell wall biosynthesis